MATLAVEIDNVERVIYGLAHEEGYGWNAVETAVSHAIGNAYKITWGAQDMLKIINGTITHNHPRPSLPCPSLQDLMFMRGNYLKELRVVSKDYFLWRKCAHRVCTRRGLTWPRFDEQHYIDVMKAIYSKRRISYYTDSLGSKIHPREIIKASIDATDEALIQLGAEWGFIYKAWSD